MSEAPITLLGMEDQLLADRDGRRRDAIAAELAQYLEALRRQMDAGASVDEFKRLTKLRAALEAADKIVQQTWQRFSGSRGPA